MKRTLGLIAAGLLFTAASCKKDELHVNDVYESDDLSIAFVNYTDSRCPHNADCIWAGEVEVFLKATQGSTNVDFSLKGLGADTILFGYNIEFVDLLPYPEAGVEVPVEDVELTLNVTEL